MGPDPMGPDMADMDGGHGADGVVGDMDGVVGLAAGLKTCVEDMDDVVGLAAGHKTCVKIPVCTFLLPFLPPLLPIAGRVGPHEPRRPVGPWPILSEGTATSWLNC